MLAVVENRNDVRSCIEAYTLFRPINEDQFQPARIGNISKSGILIWLDEALMLGELIKVVISPYDEDQPTKLVIAEVVRIHEVKHADAFGYGCRIKAYDIISELEF